MPAGEADKVKEAGRAIGAETEEYVREVILDRWESIKDQLQAQPVSDEVQALINQIDRHILDIPRTVVNDILSEVHLMTFGSYQPLVDFNRLLVVARGTAGWVNPREANELRQELNGRKIIDGVVRRMSE